MLRYREHNYEHSLEQTMNISHALGAQLRAARKLVLKKTPAIPIPVLSKEVSAAVDRITLRTIGGRDDVPESAKQFEDISLSRKEFSRHFINVIELMKGDDKITFLSTPPLKREFSHDVAEGFRLNQDYGLVLDPSELLIEGWEDQDYAEHWSDVRKALSKDINMVMGPGWEKSPECLRDVKHAKKLGIPVQKLVAQPLSRMDIEIRLQESAEELRQRGFDPPDFLGTLNGAVDQDYLSDVATGDFTTNETLKDPEKYVSDVVARTLQGRDESDNDGARQAGKISQPLFTELYVKAAKEQLDGKPMTYISTPITGGTKKFDLFEELGVNDKKEFDKNGKNRFVKDVIVANTNRAFRISESVRQRTNYGSVMDPSEITIPDWSQSHYAAHWDAVVKELASKVVLAPGWDFSTGCILELKRALDKGIPIEEIALNPLRLNDYE